MISHREIFDLVAENAKEARDLYITNEITKLDGPPSPLEFHRNFVAKNIPCIFSNAIANWPAVKKWNLKYLQQTLKNKNITVAVTPNGYSDAVSSGLFMLPEEMQIPADEAMSLLCPTQTFGNKVYYIQKQNSNLTFEFPELVEDVAEHLPWATSTFNRRPDAVNFWMGNSTAVTSLHKDHYENLYCVIKGKKIFTLYPPSDRPFIPYKDFRIARYALEKGEWSIIRTEDYVPWIPVDPLNPDYVRYPQFRSAKPIRCEVEAGEILYLPALWFHHVQQSDETIAVNYWYDMDFDMKYTYYQLMDKLSSQLEHTDDEIDVKDS